MKTLSILLFIILLIGSSNPENTEDVSANEDNNEVENVESIENENEA